MAKEFICSAASPVVQTNAGKLRGFVVDGTYTFHGIKYADANSGGGSSLHQKRFPGSGWG